MDRPGEYLFREITAQVEPGQRIAILGTSGQGKSTLLRILARLDTQSEGAIRLAGREARDWKPAEWRRRIGYVAQQPVMLPGTVEMNLKAASDLHGKPFNRDLAERCMDAAGLGGLDWRKLAGELSGGEKQRTALVRSMLLEPEAMLLDEVTSALDPASKRAVERLLGEWSEQRGTALLWVTHDLEQARLGCDTVWFMADNRLLEAGPAPAFFRAPATEKAREFVRSLHAEGRSAGHV
ncbi:ATP-binding cassette domain-containing protein [Paenibacillus ginsengarvi]|uniref:ATP-binding cassette domain-containing protein n=2 Tax=Paenibacillus ginsengarvi TaxID=400777 RepID=A0A3B0CCE6_9BACL|nr:ATP-binding cassette domain-containing protein [Paenibacillus ginsengarvi]